jgi:hypothetical protein
MGDAWLFGEAVDPFGLFRETGLVTAPNDNANVPVLGNSKPAVLLVSSLRVPVMFDARWIRRAFTALLH